MAFGLASHDANVQGTRVVCGLSSASENSNSRCLESVRVWIMHGDLCVRESFFGPYFAFLLPPFSLRWLARRRIGFNWAEEGEG